MAVFAPMPNASDRTATAVNTGDFLKDRKANRRSFEAEAIICLDRAAAIRLASASLFITAAPLKSYSKTSATDRGHRTIAFGRSLGSRELWGPGTPAPA